MTRFSFGFIFPTTGLLWRMALLVALTIAGLGLSGCYTTYGPYDVSGYHAGQANDVQYATVVSAHNVTIRDGETGLGTAAGAVVGGAFGSTVGGGTPENIAVGIVGAIAGGLIGHAIEKGVSQHNATEYVVRTDHGETLSVVQGNDYLLAPGQKVMMVYSGGGRNVRLVPVHGSSHSHVAPSVAATSSNTPRSGYREGPWQREDEWSQDRDDAWQYYDGRPAEGGSSSSPSPNSTLPSN